MIDTLKLGIPLTKHQLTKLQRLLVDDETWQWVQLQPSTGELRLVRCRGLAHLDQNSFHREIRWDCPQSFMPDQTFLTLEFSVPKFWYGHNIHLLYDLSEPLSQLKKILEAQLHCRFTDPMTWKVWRVDCCYAWRAPNQRIAQQVLDSLKRLNFPRKKPVIYPETILFTGSTYSVKFYLKYCEFLKNDRKALIKDKASFEWINYLEDLSRGVVRYEATLRRKYLKRKKIDTVSDLTKSLFSFEWSQEFFDLNAHIDKDNKPALYMCQWLINLHNFGIRCDVPYENYPADSYWDAPPQCYLMLYYNIYQVEYYGGGFTLRKSHTPVSILQYFLTRFLGDKRNMQEADEVKAKLQEKYKPVKAARLMAVWLYVQKYGVNQAKQEFGRDSFDRTKREIKNAGCSFVEPPVVITADDRFLKSFAFDVPSPYVTNTVDDFRDTSNVINLIPRIIERELGS